LIRQQITNTLDDAKDILEEICKTFPDIVPTPILVGSGKNYLNGCSLVPHDIDIVIPVNIVSKNPDDIIVLRQPWQSKLERIFKKTGLLECEYPIQIHTTPIDRVEWMKMRMSPPHEYRGYVLGAFLTALGREINIYFGYTGALCKMGETTQIVTLNPNFSKDILLFKNHYNDDVMWKSESIDDLWKSSIDIITNCDCKVERFHTSLIKNLARYESNDESYSRALDIINKLYKTT